MLEFIQNNISVFDLIVFLITTYCIAQCAAKGFTLSLLSFSKWLIALVITIVFGFSILFLSNFIPTIYFGIFTGIAMMLALISVLTLLPKLILLIKPFGNR